MSVNMGNIDQFVRSLMGFALIAFIGRKGEIAPDSGPLLVIAVYLYVTAIVSYCPLYHWAGVSTLSKRDGSA